MTAGMIFDLVVIGVLIASSIIAFLRGFIRETLTVLGVAGGLVCAYFMGPHLAPAIGRWIGTDPDPEVAAEQAFLGFIPYSVAADALAYGSIFIIFVIVLSVLSHLLSGAAKAVGLGPVDRTCGVIFGILRGVVLLALLYAPFMLVNDKEKLDHMLEGSSMQFYVEGTSAFLVGLIPESFTADLNKRIEERVGSAAESTREKLQELEVLQNSGAPGQDGVDAVTETPIDPDAPPEGYDPGERENMGRLIEDTGPQQ